MEISVPIDSIYPIFTIFRYTHPFVVYKRNIQQSGQYLADTQNSTRKSTKNGIKEKTRLGPLARPSARNFGGAGWRLSVQLAFFRFSGLEVIRIINEPTAAAMAYGLHQHLGMRTVLVLDFGGGTLDVSLLNVQGGMFLTQAMAGKENRL